MPRPAIILPPRRVVITVHGLNTVGKWQEDVRHILEAYFDYRAIKYEHYRWLGFLRQVLGPYSVFLLPLAVGTILAMSPRWWESTLLVGILVLPAAWEAARYRSRTVDSFAEECDRLTRKGEPPPFLIAHSLGTYLSAHALKRSGDLKFEKMILIGCVLPRSFDWKAIFDDPRKGLHCVRNEVGWKDSVVWLAGTAGSLLPGFGGAGRWGFRRRGITIHSIDTPHGACGQCAPDVSANQVWAGGTVHNVALKEFDHGARRMTRSHCVEVWLPFLWGIDSSGYMEFVRDCIEAAHADPISERAVMKERQIRKASWDWTLMEINGVVQKVPFEDYMRALVEREATARNLVIGVRGPQHVTQLIDGWCDRAIRMTWELVKEARELADGTPRGGREKAIMEALHPVVAACRAAAAVVG